MDYRREMPTGNAWNLPFAYVEWKGNGMKKEGN
jgi:hypothetical protein